jgi:hypothetical protein
VGELETTNADDHVDDRFRLFSHLKECGVAVPPDGGPAGIPEKTHSLREIL